MPAALVIVGLLLLVGYMATRTPAVDPNAVNRQKLPPDTSVPATGAGGVIGPAMSAGAPHISQPNQLRLMTNFGYTGFGAQRLVQSLPPAPIKQTADAPLGPTQADSSITTQSVPVQVGVKLPGGGVKTNTSPLVRKL